MRVMYVEREAKGCVRDGEEGGGGFCSSRRGLGVGGEGEKDIGWKEGMGWDVLKWEAGSITEKKWFLLLL